METDDKKALPIEEINLTSLNGDEIYYSGIKCDVFINKEHDIVVINFPGIGGGVRYYTSEKSGLLLSFDDDAVFVVGIFMDGFLESIKLKTGDTMLRPERCKHCGRHPEIRELSGGWSIECDSAILFAHEQGKKWCEKGMNDNFGYHLFDAPNDALLAWNRWIIDDIEPVVED